MEEAQGQAEERWLFTMGAKCVGNSHSFLFPGAWRAVPWIFLPLPGGAAPDGWRFRWFTS